MNNLQGYTASRVSPLQHGFVRGRSITTNLVSLATYIVDGFAKGAQTDVIYTDFSKAFDQVNHRILLRKLGRFGFSPPFCKWVSSYLAGRSQQVAFNSSISRRITVTSGVPQGSHLGPLFFVIFVDELHEHIKNSQLLLYADDAKIFSIVRNVNDAARLNADLQIMDNWCRHNRLDLNVAKCKIMSFGRKNDLFRFDYTIAQQTLERVTYFKDLGVLFDPKLSFHAHIEHIVNKANSSLGAIKRWSKEFNDPHVCKSLYMSLVRPVIEFASTVWCPTYDNTIKRIESIQRKFLRFALCQLPWRNPIMLPPYRNRLKLLDMNTLEDRRCISNILFVFKIISGETDALILLSKFNLKIPSRPTRKYVLLNVSRTSRNYLINASLNLSWKHFNAVYEIINFNENSVALKHRLSNYFKTM